MNTAPWRRRLADRIGHRGAVLLFFGLLDVMYSLSLAKPPAEAIRSPSVAFLAAVLPLPAWAVLWGVTGLVVLAGAFCRSDRWAFSAAVLLKVLWGGTMLAGWILGGLDRGWVAAVVWLAMAVMLFIISTWPEPLDDAPVYDPDLE